jgi:putative PEP-CTERM system histidine kinase
MPVWVDTTFVLHAACAVLYAALAMLVLARGRRDSSGFLLAAGSLATAAWAASVSAMSFLPAAPLAFALDLARPFVWLAVIIDLYRRVTRAGRPSRQLLALLGLLAILLAVTGFLLSHSNPGGGVNLRGVWVTALMGLAIATLLVIENLYFSTPADVRWHVSLPCIALGALALYDAALAGDTLLSHTLSPVLFNGRPLAAILVAPLLAIAAARNRRNWQADLTISRTAVLHTATLVVAGLFLLGLVAAGQAIRYIGPGWGGVAQASLLFGGLLAVAVLVTSRSARSRLRFLLVDHLFAQRYDYRREWMRCIATLSATEGYVALHARVIRAVADIVDSPGGILFVRDGDAGAFDWAGSWNQPAAPGPVAADDPLVEGLRGGEWIVAMADLPPREGLPPAWLAVPLNHGGRLIGFVLLAPPRAPFRLDREVYDLLRVVGRQVATVVAEQRAAEILMQTRQLHEYGKRFAFVAHDIKNVSTQLTLLLANAEVHLGNPDFQRDMLATIRASVAKIGALIKRLETPPGEVAQSVVMPAERLGPIIDNARRSRGIEVALEVSGTDIGVAMPAASFDAVMIHLLDNAMEATRASHAERPPPVQVTLRHEARHTVIDIVDEGSGMNPDFIRDGLFRPFRTSKPGGSGIGAYQARELVREAGGDLVVISQPGAGTTMRLLLPTVEAAARPAALTAP